MIVPALPSIIFEPVLSGFQWIFCFSFTLLSSDSCTILITLASASFHWLNRICLYLSLQNRLCAVPHQLQHAFYIVIPFNLFFPLFPIVKRAYFVVATFLCTVYRHMHGFCKCKGSCCCLFFLKCFQEAKTFQNTILSIWNALILFHL